MRRLAPVHQVHAARCLHRYQLVLLCNSCRLCNCRSRCLPRDTLQHCACLAMLTVQLSRVHTFSTGICVH